MKRLLAWLDREEDETLPLTIVGGLIFYGLICLGGWILLSW